MKFVSEEKHNSTDLENVQWIVSEPHHVFKKKTKQHLLSPHITVMLISGSFSCFRRFHSTTSFLTFRHLICSPHVALLSRFIRLLNLTPKFPALLGFKFYFQFPASCTCYQSFCHCSLRSCLEFFFPKQLIFPLFSHRQFMVKCRKDLDRNSTAIPEFVHARVINSQYKTTGWQSKLILSIKIETETNILQKNPKIGTYLFFFFF